MSMSSHVVGFRKPDTRWKEMKAIWDSCQKANVPIPESVAEFFGDIDPDERGIEVEIPHEKWDDGDDGMCEGFEIELAKMPPNITHVRFFNSH